MRTWAVCKAITKPERFVFARAPAASATEYNVYMKHTLQKCLEFDRQGFTFFSTALGRLMAKYYLKFITVINFEKVKWITSIFQ